MITIVTLTDDLALRHLTPDELCTTLIEQKHLQQDWQEESPAPSQVYWIDLNNPTREEEEKILIEAFNVHQLALEDCRQIEDDEDVRVRHLPKVEDFDRYLFSIMNPLVRTEDEGNDGFIKTLQLNTFLGENFIITHHYEHLAAIDKALTLCSVNPRHIHRGPDFIYHIILDFIVDDLSDILDDFDEQIDKLEDEVFSNSNSKTLPKILTKKRQIFQLRRITTYQREMVYRLSRGEFDLITDQEIVYYRNVFDHLVRAADLTESYRDILTGLLDAQLSMTSNRMNEVMKVLTIISTVFLPLTFIAGLYGMNFEKMPEIHWDFGYPFALLLMLIVSLGMIGYFRYKKWL